MPEGAENTTVTTPVEQNNDVARLREDMSTALTRLAETQTENRRLAEIVERQERSLTESRIDNDLRQLSEQREIALSDTEGAATRGVTPGIAPAVLTRARELMLENMTLREPVLELLRLVQDTGTVPLSEMGVGRSGDERDPFVPVTLSDDPDGSKWIGRAKDYAKRTLGKEWLALSEPEREGALLATEQRARR